MKMHELTEVEIIELRAKNLGISYSKAEKQVKMLKRRARNRQELVNIGKAIIGWYRRVKTWTN